MPACKNAAIKWRNKQSNQQHMDATRALPDENGATLSHHPKRATFRIVSIEQSLAGFNRNWFCISGHFTRSDRAVVDGNNCQQVLLVGQPEAVIHILDSETE